MKIFTRFIGYIVCLSLIACFKNEQMAGVVSETQNGSVSGYVTDEHGQVAAGVVVTLYSDQYNAGNSEGNTSTGIQSTTDSRGRFSFKNIKEGKCNLIARNSARKAAIQQHLQVQKNGGEINAKTMVMTKTGAIVVRLPGLNVKSSGYFYIPGTDVFARLDSLSKIKKEVILEGVPPANFMEVRYVGGRQEDEKNILKDSLTVKAADSAVIGPLAFWSHIKKITINTTVSGANIKEGVAEFPLLVRLNGQNFDFSNANSFGEDIQFVKGDSVTILSHSIERWNAVGQRAEVWVKMDTVLPNSDSQFVYMVSGLNSDLSLLENTTVFDTSEGYFGVWHFNEPSSVVPNAYKDASVLGLRGTGSGFNGSLDTQAVIARGQGFDGVDDLVRMPLSPVFNGNPDFTVSFWMNFQQNTNRSWICMMGTQDLRKGYHWTIRLNNTAQFGIRKIDSAADEPSYFDLNKYENQWAHFTTVRDASKNSLLVYVNGVRQDSLLLLPISLDVTNGFYVGEGFRSDEFESRFKGYLDEMRIMNTVTTPAAVKLNYENQRIDSKVMRVE